MDLRSSRERRDEQDGAKELHARRVEIATRWLMSESHGRLILWELMRAAGSTSSQLVSFNPNAMTMAHDAGKKEAVCWLQDLAMRNCHEQFALMTEENNK